MFWCLYRLTCFIHISSISIADIEQIGGSLVGGFSTSDLMSSFLASSVVSVTLWEALSFIHLGEWMTFLVGHLNVHTSLGVLQVF